MTLQIPLERFYEMSRVIFGDVKKIAKQYRIETNSGFASMYGINAGSDYQGRMHEKANLIGHLAGLAWLAHEAGEAAEREKNG